MSGIPIPKPPQKTDDIPDHLKEINEELYKRNLELAIKNKTLSLLRTLYDISIKTLDAVVMSQQIVEAIQTTLALEAVSMLRYDQGNNEIRELGRAGTANVLAVLGTQPNVVIDNASSRNFFEKVIVQQEPLRNEVFGYILGNAFGPEIIEHARETTGIKSSLIYPLALEHRTLGILVIGLTSSFSDLPQYEQELMDTIANVVAIALDKVLVYDELQQANVRLQELDKVKNEFVSFATHQMRSPLVSVKWGLETLMDEQTSGPLNDAQKKLVNQVSEIATTMTNTVNDLLDISKIEQGGLVLQFAPFAVGDLARSIVETMAPVATKKGLVLSYGGDAAAKFQINGDEGKLRQVIVNLVDNSIKYTETGTISVAVAQAGEEITVSITDTGRGFTAEEGEKLFRKFERGSGKTVNKGGSGLGLFLAKKIVEMHGGKIWATSPGTGQGSTFAFTLLVNPPAPEKPKEETVPAKTA